MAGETELIKERLDVADVVGEYVALKRVGGHFKALCPFHQEKTPSFVVSPDKGIWHCFGCGKGGDVFSFIQEIEGVEFREALKLLAEKAGVELKQSNLVKSTRDSRQRLFELLELSAKFYHEILLHQKAGARAKKYLEERGVTGETMEKFQVGYAPNGWDTLQQFLRSKGFHPREMVAAGVVGEGRGGKMYDRFRGRIMFPIDDVQGRIVAFGGRIAPWHATGEEGKYINSPETELYAKRRVLYNLSRAKGSLRHGAGIVMEGYMDVVMSVQAGAENVVAASGTAFTDAHAQLLQRYTSDLHFAFDSDAAGNKATIAATQAALQAGMQVATIVFPPGKDPADMVQENPEEFRQILASPRSLVSVLLERLEEEQKALSSEEQLKALVPLIAQVENPIQQGRMVQELAQILHVPETQIFRLLEAPAGAGQAAAEEQLEPAISASRGAEGQILGIIWEDPAVRKKIWPLLRFELFLDPRLQELYNTMHSLAESREDWWQLAGGEMAELMPDYLRPTAEGLRIVAGELLERSSEGAADEAQALLRFLSQRFLKYQLTHMHSTLATDLGDKREEVLQKFQSVVDELAELQHQDG